MLICDTHADTPWSMIDPDRTPGTPFDITMAHLIAAPEHTRVQAQALFAGTEGPEVCREVVRRELSALDAMKQQGWRQVRNPDEAVQGEANFLLTIEGCEVFLGDVDKVDFFADLGVRVAALTWNNPNGLCHPALSGVKDGLTPLGRQIVKRMRQRHIAVDVSHLNVRGVFDLLEDGVQPPMASHSCVYSLCHHDRNLTDDQLRALFEAGGFVGVNFFPGFLSNDGVADIDRVIDHMAYMCDMGGENCVGFGSDFDGIDGWPDGLRNAGDVPKLVDGLMRRGFGKELTEKIAGLNFKNYLERI